MNFDEFIQAAWSDHADHADDVGRRLADSLALIAAPAQVAPTRAAGTSAMAGAGHRLPDTVYLFGWTILSKTPCGPTTPMYSSSLNTA